MAAERGKISGNHEYAIPAWFKDSFMEFKQDAQEAREKNKHVILFLHLEACPYCSRMLDENFRQGEIKKKIQSKFDVIAVNIKGDKEIIWDDSTSYTEKSLASALNVHFTPTIVFLNADGNKVLQLNGYRNTAAFNYALDYVSGKHYLVQKFRDYIRQHEKPVYSFKSHPQFSDITDFSSINGPLALIIEDSNCADCDEFHQKILNHPDVLKELSAFKVVRIDANSNKAITGINGNKTTFAAWVKQLNMDYRPGTILFNDGEEVARADGRLFSFHYKELLRYVSGSYNFEYSSYNQYLRFRQSELLNKGININFSE